MLNLNMTEPKGKAYKDSILYFAKKNYEESSQISEKKISISLPKNNMVQAARLLGEAFVKHSNYKEGRKILLI